MKEVTKKQVAERAIDVLSKMGHHVSVVTIVKGNDCVYYGVSCFQKEGVGVNVYVQDYNLDEDDPVESFVDDVLKVVTRNDFPEISSGLVTKLITEENIRPRLVRTDWNAAILAHSPHREVSDLALYYVFQAETKRGLMAVRITDTLAAEKGWSEPFLYEKAMAAVKEEAVMKPLANVLGNMLPPRGFFNPLTVVSTKSGAFGAAAVFAFKDSLKGNWLIPSSIHEWLAMDGEASDVEALSEIIRAVNAETVAEEEQLSDHPYKWSDLFD